MFSRLKKIWNSLFGSSSTSSSSASSSSSSSGTPSTNSKSQNQRKAGTPSSPAGSSSRPRREQRNKSTETAHERTNPAKKPAKSILEQTNGEWSAIQQPLGNKKAFDNWEPPVANPEIPGLFQNFAIHKRILKAIINDLKFEHCTPIQEKSLPILLNGQDLAGKAQTGTGKTAVFLIQLLQTFLQNQESRKLNQPFALALAPTRELALQIAEDAENLSTYTNLRTVAVFGGIDYERQRKLVQSGCDFIVATPGRLIDFINQRAIDLSMLKILVIDEADRMLDMGFIPDVKRIIAHAPAPQDRQTMLFSATLSTDIMNLASRWMRPSPAVVEIEPEHIVAEGIDETTYACTTEEKFPILLWTLSHEDCTRVIIFRNRRRDVEELHDMLLRAGVASEMLSGDVDQKKRLKILELFKEGKVQVIVATDVAGRGIHVDDVTHVINYDFPYEAEDYVHRVGRTARAGHRGRAINFADESCAFVIPDIETYINRGLPITNPTEEMLTPPELAPRQGKGKRSSAAASSSSEHPGGYGHGGSRRSGFNSRPAGQHIRRGGFRH